MLLEHVRRFANITVLRKITLVSNSGFIFIIAQHKTLSNTISAEEMGITFTISFPFSLSSPARSFLTIPERRVL